MLHAHFASLLPRFPHRMPHPVPLARSSRAPPAQLSQGRCWWWWCSHATIGASAGCAHAPPIAAASHLSLPDVAKHMFQVFSDVSTYVASVHIDVAKVNRDDSYVAMVVDVCCKLLFSMFHMFFRCILQLCLSGYFIFFTHILRSVLSRCCVCLQWFQVFLGVFACVSDSCFKCFICLQTYVASVVSRCFKSRSGVASPSTLLFPRHGVFSSSWRRLGIRYNDVARAHCMSFQN
jgi:hypothetical protein